MADIAHQIGSRIRALRRARTSSARSRRGRSLTIEELAEASDLSTSYLNKLELGEHQPSAETILKIAHALDVHPGELFPSDGKASEKSRALDELRAFAGQFSSEQVKYLLEVVRAVMAKPKPKRKARSLPP